MKSNESRYRQMSRNGHHALPQRDGFAACYFLLQSVLGAAWWFGLFVSLEFRSLFVPTEYPDSVLLSLVGADGALFVIGSLVAAMVVFKPARFPKVLRSIPVFVLGATAYATLMCWGWALCTNAAWPGGISMTLALIGTSWAVWRVR